MSWKYHYRCDNSSSRCLISVSFFIPFFACFLLMNINTFITCTTYLYAGGFPPSKSLWLDGLFSSPPSWQSETSLYCIWMLKGGNWGALIDLISCYLCQWEATCPPFSTKTLLGELLTIEKYNEVLFWAANSYFIALFNHIFTWPILDYVAATFSSGAKTQPVLATTWVGNLSRPDSWIQTEQHKKAKGGEGEHAVCIEKQWPHEGSDLWMN